MNTKRLPEVIMVACLIGLAAWWWWPVKPVPVKTPVVQFRPPPPPEEIPVQPVTSALPVVAVEPTAPATVDPQADLSTAIPDYIRLLQSGDYATLLQNYDPPDPLFTEKVRAKIAQLWQEDAQTPEGQLQAERELWDLQFIQSSTPIISDNGNTATYELPPGRTVARFIFVKINGRWYMN